MAPQAFKLLLRAQRQNPLTGDRSSRGMERAVTYDEWEKAQREHLLALALALTLT